MQHYPTNSPQAAARIVALALLSDGHLCKAEIDRLDALSAHDRLGLTRTELHQVLHQLSLDLLQAAQLNWGGASALDAELVESLLDDVQDDTLRATVLNLCVAAIDADGHLADGESEVLLMAWRRWSDTLHAVPTFAQLQKLGSVASEMRPAAASAMI